MLGTKQNPKEIEMSNSFRNWSGKKRPLIWALIPILVLTALTLASSLSAQELSLSPATVSLGFENGTYYLKIENIDLDGIPISAKWGLDFSTANWTLKEASMSVSPDLLFTPDPGIRVEYASNPGAIVDPTTGMIYLYYEDHSQGEGPGAKMIQSSTDGLNFSNPVEEGTLHARLNPRAVLLPDGTWRKYIYNQNDKTLVSESSTDGTNFTRDQGARYTLTEGDNGTFGVYDIYVDHTGGVVMLYVGAMGGADNVRRAYSTDGGNTFYQETDDLLGDKELAHNMKYVDPKTVLLPDGRRRLITMRRGPNGSIPQPGVTAIGELHTFISTNGKDYYHEPGIRLKYSDFTEFEVWSLNDPVMIRLPDGRYRIYVAALITDDSPTATHDAKWVILSATSQ